MLSNYINHIVFVIDGSGSMRHLSGQVVRVFDEQIEYLAKQSQKKNQETRVSVYVFNTATKCLIYDMDVMRLPSLKQHYNADGGTALIEATAKAITDLSETPQRYGDHSFFVYVLTDGQNTENGHLSSQLSRQIAKLDDNWTVAVLVPDRHAANEAIHYGFPKANIDMWDTTEAGFEVFNRRTRETMDRYMDNRAKGIRGTKNLFTVDTASLTRKDITSTLDPLKPSQYELASVRRDSAIRDFVENQVGVNYTPGCAYYELTKPETVQRNKQICIRDDRTDCIYAGDAARSLLGIPKAEVRVKPDDHSNFTVFVQSTSVNRKLVGGTELLVVN